MSAGKWSRKGRLPAALKFQRMLPLFRSKDELMSREEKDRLIQSIKVLEQRTSGEIRIYIEGNCPAADAMSRCKELFLHLNMQ